MPEGGSPRTVTVPVARRTASPTPGPLSAGFHPDRHESARGLAPSSVHASTPRPKEILRSRTAPDRHASPEAASPAILSSMLPETRYTRLGDLNLAYQVIGEGPPDILLLDQWFGHVEAQWDVAPVAEFRERLASFGRLIMFDKRGTGLSDPIPTASLPTLEEFMGDIPAVLDSVGSDRAALIANIGGGILAIPFAAATPERVSSLILVDCFARFLEAPDFPIGAPPEGVGQALQQAEDETGRAVMLDIFAPSVAHDERTRRAWARYERNA